jgi:hypothetical protein
MRKVARAYAKEREGLLVPDWTHLVIRALLAVVSDTSGTSDRSDTPTRVVRCSGSNVVILIEVTGQMADAWNDVLP